MQESSPLPGIHSSGVAFTLIELLVSVTILSAILVCILSAIGQTSTIWRRTSDQIEAFQDARAAFDLLTRNISQATLNTYLDYDDATAPTNFFRCSDLQFICGSSGTGVFPGTLGTGQALFFQAPASWTKDSSSYGGLEGLLNGCGYYVEFKSDEATTPIFVKGAPVYRYRLMQLLIPTENNKIYVKDTGTSWFENHSSDAQPIAKNIIALIIRPQDPAATSSELNGVIPPDLTSDYQYDSAKPFIKAQPITSNQLPPMVQVTMVAITESSAKRLESGSNIPGVIRNALAKKFSDPAKYASDLEDLKTALNTTVPHIEYRIFSSAVPIRESRWSK